jgi:predicted dehydrogenase
MNNKKLRIGIIGGSVNNGWAKTTHIPAVQQLPELELSAVSTSSMESAEKSAREFKADHAFADASELSKHPEVDMVVVSINVRDHYDAVKEVVSAGKPVYCEWPLGSNTAQAMEMQQWAESNHVRNTVGLQARQAPEINYVKDLIADGFIGKVLSVNMKIYTDMMGGVGYKVGAYLFDKKIGGTLLTILGGHSIDALTYMLGDFKEVSSTMERHYKQAKIIDTDEIIEKTADDQIMITGKLASGATANVHIQGGVKHQSGAYLEIYGEEGTIILSAPNTNGHIQMGPYNLLGARQNEGESKQSTLQKLTVPDQYFWVPDTINNEDSRALNVAQAHRKFAKDIQEGSSHMPTFADAVKLHQLLDAIVKATETGERQYL